MLAKASYGPYARAMIRICREERFHKKQGFEIMATLAAGTEGQRQMAQDALNRWWWPSLMMFGPPDDQSPNSAVLMKWRVKHESNDTLRQRFVNLTVRQAQAIGLEIPDPDMTHDEETGDWCFGEIDWTEFWEVVKGRGPMNRDRIEARNKAHDEGEWVRHAAEAYTKKRAAKQPAA
jgi:ring-1,2-phenylacetyl-CoA epoxidase subunit PaaA